jgi:hypothetical protein
MLSYLNDPIPQFAEIRYARDHNIAAFVCSKGRRFRGRGRVLVIVQ